jgi:hypothetical protein
MLPVFLVAAGDVDGSDFTYFPLSIQSKVRGKNASTWHGRLFDVVISFHTFVLIVTGLRPKTSTSEKLAILCVFPLLLSGILGSPSSHQQLEEYLRKVLIQNTKDGSFSMHHTTEIINSVRFLWWVITQWNHIAFNILMSCMFCFHVSDFLWL